MNRVWHTILACTVAAAPALAQDAKPAEAQPRENAQMRIEKLAESLSSGTERIREQVLTAKGRIADALLADKNESLYTRLDEAADELEDAAENLDPGVRGAVGMESSVAEKELRIIRQTRAVASMARAVETELAGGGFPDALQTFNSVVKPALTDLQKALPMLSAYKDKPAAARTQDRM